MRLHLYTFGEVCAMKRARSILAFMLALLLMLMAVPVYADETAVVSEGGGSPRRLCHP